MKKLFFLILCFAFLNGKSQTYLTIPDSGATWTCLLSRDFHPTTNYSFAKISVIKSVGDSVICTEHYIKLTTSGDQYDYSTFIPPTWANVHPTFSWRNRYYGLLKDDGSGKIYFRDTLSSVDSLLYDYNALQIGHIIPATYLFPDTSDPSFSAPIVIAQDSILLCNQYHKRWIIEDTTRQCDTNAIIEGMGGTFGLTENIPWCLFFENYVYSYLTGFDNNDSCQWGGSIGDLSAISPIEKTEKEFIVSPNPSNGKLNVVFPSGKSVGEVHWELFNYFGQLVDQGDEPANGNLSFDFELQPDGMYFLQLKSANASFNSTKILITK